MVSVLTGFPVVSRNPFASTAVAAVLFDVGSGLGSTLVCSDCDGTTE